MTFPVSRPRRLRRTEVLRNFVRETRLTPEGFIYPLFVCAGEGVRKPIGSMPGVFNLSIDETVKECREVKSLGIPAVILFGLPEKKDEVATGAWADDGIVQKATRAIKAAVPGLMVIGDVCLCEYMSHGHCGIVKAAPQSLGAAVAAPPAVTTDYEIVNDASLELLARTSVSLAKAAATIKNVDTIITGHSTVMTFDDLKQYADFNKDFLGWVQAEMTAGKSVDDAAAEYRIPGKYAGYTNNPAQVKTNVGVIYNELKKP